MSDLLWHPKAKRYPAPEDGGSFTGGGMKFLVHTTEGLDFDAMVRVLLDKRAEPHFILALENGKRRLGQFIPINRAARALEHPSGTPQTNRANCIQVEVCQYAKDAQRWPRDLYQYLHLLFLWVHRHAGVPMKCDHPFYGQDGYHRLSPSGFIHAKGLLGHCHAASQPGGHWDPGNLKQNLVVKGTR